MRYISDREALGGRQFSQNHSKIKQHARLTISRYRIQVVTNKDRKYAIRQHKNNVNQITITLSRIAVNTNVAVGKGFRCSGVQ